MNYAIISIPKQLNRTCIMLGCLEQSGFPIVNLLHQKRIKIYNGYNYRDDMEEMREQMVADGFNVSPYLPMEMKPIHARTLHYNYLKVLRIATEKDRPTLIMENDAKFRNLTYETLNEKWDQLVDDVGYKNINIAMLFSYENEQDQDDKVTPVNDFWGRGSRNSGQVANIWTPHGAEYYLENHLNGHVEYTLLCHPDMPGLYTTLENQIDFTIGATIDAPRRPKHLNELLDEFLKGESLCQPLT